MSNKDTIRNVFILRIVFFLFYEKVGVKLSCKDCPYGKTDFERLSIDNQTETNELEQYIYCEKVGGKVWRMGRCSDSCNIPLTQKVYSNKKKLDKRHRYLKHKRYLKTLHKNLLNSEESPVRLDDTRNKTFYRRLYRRQASKYLKRLSNKKIRRSQETFRKGNGCHKIFDYWYELY